MRRSGDGDPLAIQGQAGATPVPVEVGPDVVVTANPTRPSVASVSTVAASATSVTLAALNTNRVWLSIYNDSTAILYVKTGATASSSSYTVQMAGGSYYEFPQPCYTGVVDGIWASATGHARMTEAMT